MEQVCKLFVLSLGVCLCGRIPFDLASSEVEIKASNVDELHDKEDHVSARIDQELNTEKILRLIPCGYDEKGTCWYNPAFRSCWRSGSTCAITFWEPTVGKSFVDRQCTCFITSDDVVSGAKDMVSGAQDMVSGTKNMISRKFSSDPPSTTGPP